MSNAITESDRLAYLDALGITPWRSRVGEDDSDPDELAESAPETAVDAALLTDWAGLQQAVATCTRCDLHKSRTQTVFGVGSSNADLLVIGEAPGAEEDRRGEPFVGKAGQLLDEMLRAIGLDRKVVYIANILKCRPPGNRDPQDSEAASCRRYLDAQINLLQPKVILAVGRIAAQQLLGNSLPLGRMRGQRLELASANIPVIVTYHPAYLLRTPADKRKAWHDLCSTRALLRELTT
ncbi:MAG: uracil-DNA glycosylase [Woeseia sp.]